VPIADLPPAPSAAPSAPAPTLDAVIVTARLPPAVGDAAFSIMRIDQADLQAQPRLDEALKSVPGVSLFRRTSSAGANPTTQGVSLRSIGPSGAGRALVTLDGVPQNDPFGGWVIWTSLPAESLDGVSIVRGAGAGPYGAGALTGVVALDEMSRPGAINAEASLAQRGGLRGAAALDQQVGGADLMLSASAEHSDGWIPVQEGRGAADTPLGLDDWSLAARLQAPVGRALLAMRVAAYREDRDAGLVGAGSTARGEDASITLTAQPSVDELGWRLQAWLRDSDLSNTSVAVAPDRSSTTPANDQYATPALGWGFNAALRGQADAIQWEVGADVRGADGESRELFRNLGDGFTRARISGGRTLVGGAYAEASHVDGPWLFTGGARLDAWASQAGHRTERDIASGLLTFADDPPDRSGLVPTGRLGVRRDLTPSLYVRTAAYAGFRPPTLNELYRPFRVGNDITEANAALAPERLYGVEAAVGGEGGAWSWSATGFVNRLSDAIANVTLGVGPGAVPGFPDVGVLPAGATLRQRANVGFIDAVGVEAEGSWRVAPTLTVRIAGDFTHARVDGGDQAPQLTGLRPAQAPRITATAGLDWRASERFSLHGQLRYEGARFDDDQNTRRLDPSLEVDARADLAVGGGAGLFVEADNLFNSDIQTGSTADGVLSYGEPRVLRVGVSWRR
jgi:outer membrane receptor protein involved in Fe transport